MHMFIVALAILAVIGMNSGFIPGFLRAFWLAARESFYSSYRASYQAARERREQLGKKEE